MAKNSSRGRGVILRARGAGLHRWRDEADGADGGKRYLRKRAKRRERAAWRKEAGLA